VTLKVKHAGGLASRVELTVTADDRFAAKLTPPHTPFTVTTVPSGSWSLPMRRYFVPNFERSTSIGFS
jgi:hypothetical protein